MSTPQGVESFPLAMLVAVSLEWWVTGSDIDPATGAPSRPLIQPSVPYGPTTPLIEFGASYTAGATPVELTSLDLAAATTGISIMGVAGDQLAPVLADLKILDCQNGLSLLPASNSINFTLKRSEIALQTSGPLAAGSALLVNAQVAGGGPTAPSTLEGLISGCTLRVEGSHAFAAGAGVLVQCLQFGQVKNLTIEGSTFDGGPPNPTLNDGMQYGVYVTSYAYGGLPTYPVSMSLVGNRIENCRNAAFRFRGLPFTGMTDSAPSSIEISGNRFVENVSGPGPLQPDNAQIFIDIGQGKVSSFAISSNTLLHTKANAMTVINPSAGGIFGLIGPANVTLDFSQNLVEEPDLDGVHLVVSSMNLTSTIRRNRIAGAGGHGILNRVTYVPGSGYPAQSNPDIVNNFVVDAGGDGIRNEAVSQVVPAVAFSAAPRPTYNTVAFSGGFGLRNLAVYSAPYQAFPVTNSILRDNAGSDLGPPAGLTLLNITFCNFQNPDPSTIGPSNNNDLPNFVNPAPAVRDLHLASGSVLVDRGTSTPPAAPGVDFDGNIRPLDVGPPGPPGQTGDIGADERTIP